MTASSHVVVYGLVVLMVLLVLLDAGHFRRGRHRGDWGRCRGSYLVEREKLAARVSRGVAGERPLLPNSAHPHPLPLLSSTSTTGDAVPMFVTRLPDWPPLLGEDHGSFGAFGDVHIDRADNTPLCGSVPVRYGRGEVTGGG